MPPARDKWVRRFIIPETTRHKRGFTIYKVTSVVFLKSSHEEISKVSIWKRYNDFKKLHSELNALYLRSQINENFPTFPKSKFFGRFEAEVIEERRECALKFLDFIGRHSYLYSSDIFIKFFETSHAPDHPNDCSQSLSSDTSEDDRHAYSNSVPTDNVPSQIISIFEQVTKRTESTSINSCSMLPLSAEINHGTAITEMVPTNAKESKTLNLSDSNSMYDKMQIQEAKDVDNSISITHTNMEQTTPILQDGQSFCNENKNCDKSTKNNITNGKHSVEVQAPNSNEEASSVNKDSTRLVMVHDGSDLPQCWPESSQYILIAAAHISAGFRHEALSEYEEAFTQYKMGIASLLIGVQCDSDKLRAEIIKDKISKYLQRAEKLYNRHLNCNISLLNKPVSDLQYYKVIKIMKSVMLVKDVRQNCFRILKAVEKSSINQGNISNYILRGQVPYMVRLHACIETDTTVFLILQHLGRGRLWDFITTYYKSNDDKLFTTVNVENSFENARAIDSIGSANDSVNNVMNCGDGSVESSDFESSNHKGDTNTCFEIERQQEVYSTVTTTQLLEKAQMLLRSVNETIKESNTVASRLYESNQFLNHQDDTALLNIMNTTYQPENGNVVLTTVMKCSSETNINGNILQGKEVSPLESMSSKSVIINNASSLNNVKSEDSLNNTDSSSLSDSCKDLSYPDKESTNSSIENLPTICTHFSMERRDHNKAGDIRNTLDMRKSLKTCEITTNNHEQWNDQAYENDTMLFTDSTKSSMDIEQELWTIPENVVRLWAAEILLALEALHQQEVIVRDLRPENLLLDDDDHVRLTYIIPGHETDLSKHKQPYASPELCMYFPTVPLTPATDIWSFGVILYELIVGNTFQSRHPGVFHSHSTINIPTKLSRYAKSLLLNILKYQPNERMTIPEIKQHPFFEDIDWSNLVNPS